MRTYIVSVESKYSRKRGVWADLERGVDIEAKDRAAALKSVQDSMRMEGSSPADYRWYARLAPAIPTVTCPQCGKFEVTDCRYVENIAQTFEPARFQGGTLIFDADSYKTHCESTSDEGLECPKCFATLPIPPGLEIGFD